ncbi:MAG: hypothetical protein SFX18_16375 [Pirellulales bacterium]|nr:hypothetical protein [Pirellulales bacterium]
MIVGFHVIFGMYGFWLPNDPRGSWSNFVGAWELFRYGKATKTTEVRSTAAIEHDQHLRVAAKKALKYPPVLLNGLQARAVGRGFGNYARQSGLLIWECAILPDHAHLVIGRNGHQRNPLIKIEQIVIQLKGSATRQLEEEDLHPQKHLRRLSGSVPKCFARGAWKVYLEEADVPPAIRYVRQNPVKEGKPVQNWSFVTDYRA